LGGGEIGDSPYEQVEEGDLTLLKEGRKEGKSPQIVCRARKKKEGGEGVGFAR